jgi:hypothetical protein
MVSIFRNKNLVSMHPMNSRQIHTLHLRKGDELIIYLEKEKIVFLIG